MSALLLHRFAFVSMHLSAKSVPLEHFLQRFMCIISGDLNLRSARELHKCMQRDPESDATGGNINKQSRVHLTRPLPAQRGAATSCRRHDAKVTSLCYKYADAWLPPSITT